MQDGSHVCDAQEVLGDAMMVSTRLVDSPGTSHNLLSVGSHVYMRPRISPGKRPRKPKWLLYEHTPEQHRAEEGKPGFSFGLSTSP